MKYAGSANYNLQGSVLVIETGIKPKGAVKRIMVSDLHYHHRDSKGSLIKIEIFGLQRVARMEKSVSFGEWAEIKEEKAESDRAEEKAKEQNKKEEKKSDEKSKSAKTSKK